MENNSHYIDLSKSYKNVAKETLKNRDLLYENLQVSRDLFSGKSLRLRKPIPKDLEVYPLVSGLSFESQFTEKMIDVQNNISEIIKDTLCYWVKPENFGVEYCVFKWPWEEWNSAWMPQIKKELSILKFIPFDYSINGIQINPDGCVIAKGYDQNAQIFKIRQQMKDAFTFLPKKQSSWAHIPIGRILEPLGESRFEDLLQYFEDMSDQHIASQRITSIKLIHETRWYMERHEAIEIYGSS